MQTHPPDVRKRAEAVKTRPRFSSCTSISWYALRSVLHQAAAVMAVRGAAARTRTRRGLLTHLAAGMICACVDPQKYI